jgi:uncharacterized RDD family membrane protein YckC
MSILKVQTAQNVQINYELGNLGLRLIAAILDLLAVGLYIFLAQFMLSTILSIDVFGNDLGLLFFLIIILPAMLYLPVSEYFWNGRTVGKYLLKLKVVKTDGTAPSLGDYILRWLLRTVDVKLGFLLIFFIPNSPSSESQETFMIWVVILMVVPLPIVGIVSMATSRLTQRLGDRIANTVVIQKKKLYSLADTILRATEEDYQPVYTNVLTLRDKDIYILKEALENLDRTQDYKFINSLAKKARTILAINDDRKPIDLLKTLLRDYDHLAKKRDAVTPTK